MYSFPYKNCNYSEPHSQNRCFATLLFAHLVTLPYQFQTIKLIQSSKSAFIYGVAPTGNKVTGSICTPIPLISNTHGAPSIKIEVFIA